MKSKDMFKKIAKSVPPSKQLVRIHQQSQEIVRLRETINKLEARNDEWAAEVRELRGENKPQEIIWPVKPKDIIAADWTKKHKEPIRKKHKPPYAVAWVIPPMGQGSGGHADIFRTINYLESKGHLCYLYFYDPLKASSLETIKANLTHYSSVKAEVFYNAQNIQDCDAIFATNWYTAYPVYNYKGSARKYYYVQDFEAYFEPVGSYSTLAENTYKMGLRGVTLGSWLSEKLSKEYGMECESFELGVNNEEYFLNNKNLRKKVLFYARPVTPRRGFELGILALEIFHKEHPEYEINFLGWDVSRFKNINFPYINHKILSIDKLNELYNECAAGLVLSFTNMSLLPLEMLAAGCLPVMNDAYHTRKVSYAEELIYSQPNPRALADALYKAASDRDQVNVSSRIAQYAKKFNWESSNNTIEQILVKELS